MGLAATQANLLSLTSRMSNLELRAQSISNQKMRLAGNSEAAAAQYSNALDKTKLQVNSGIQDGGSLSYIDATAYNLTNYNAISNTDKQRFLKDNSGRVIVSNSMASKFEASKGDMEIFLNQLGQTQYQTSDSAKVGLIDGLVASVIAECKSAIEVDLDPAIRAREKADKSVGNVSTTKTNYETWAKGYDGNVDKLIKSIDDDKIPDEDNTCLLYTSEAETV